METAGLFSFLNQSICFSHSDLVKLESTAEIERERLSGRKYSVGFNLMLLFLSEIFPSRQPDARAAKTTRLLSSLEWMHSSHLI